MNQLKVSVIIPVYNAEEYLCECLDSVVSQTLKDIEIICVDDGSTDGSADILHVYQNTDPRIRVLHREHSGAGSARNAGIEAAGGKYITFLDSDDLFRPQALTLMLEAAERHAAELILCSGYNFTNDRREMEKDSLGLNLQYLPETNPYSAQTNSRYLFQFTSGAPWGKLYLKAFLNRQHIRFPSLPRTEDVPFSRYAMAAAQRIAYTTELLVLHRVNNLNSLEANKDSAPLTPFEAHKILWENLDEAGLLESLRQSLINYFCSCYCRNFHSLQTVEACRAFYEGFKKTAIPHFGIDFSESSFYYNQTEYRELKEMADSDSFEDYLFQALRKMRAAAAEQQGLS